ncbi:MAG: hypothetical protein R2736_13815 [Solirubrobacterales bacterium]
MDPVDRIVLELRRDAAPIAGLVYREAGAPQPFTGWTGLFAVLQQMVACEPAASTPVDEKPPA